MNPLTAGRSCPCGTGSRYAECCAPLVLGQQSARTAEQLMRSRYTAFVVAAPDHLRRTWHPSTRPLELHLDHERQWTRLRILRVLGGGPDDDTGLVEFRADYRVKSGRRLELGAHHEVSLFVRQDGQWFYLEPEPGSQP